MTGLEHQMQITPSSGLAPDEIERLIMEAENSVENDRQTKETIMNKNRLDSMIRNARRAMAEIGKSFPLEQQQELNRILDDAEEALATGDGEEMGAALIKVELVSDKLTESMLTMA
jgi:molecular chaperone DnaK (HSP70)